MEKRTVVRERELTVEHLGQLQDGDVVRRVLHGFAPPALLVIRTETRELEPLPNQPDTMIEVRRGWSTSSSEDTRTQRWVLAEDGRWWLIGGGPNWDAEQLYDQIDEWRTVSEPVDLSAEEADEYYSPEDIRIAKRTAWSAGYDASGQDHQSLIRNGVRRITRNPYAIEDPEGL